jgi:hypothetical protein
MYAPARNRKLLSGTLIVLFCALVLSGCSNGSSSIHSTPPPPAVTTTLSIAPAAVTPGESATLTWSSTNATSCTASDAWSGSQPTSGSATVILQGTGAQTYTLICSGAGLPGQGTATLSLAPAEGSCAVGSGVRAHGKRTVHGRKMSGSHS